MKFKVIAISLLSTLATSVYAASGVICAVDMRPVDGSYKEVSLIENETGKFDAFYRVITSGFGGPATESKVTIAKNLTCAISQTNAAIVACVKSSREENESINSGFNTTFNFAKGVGTNGVDYQVASYKVEAYSPQLKSGGAGFPTEIKNAHVEFTFNDGQQFSYGCKPVR